jgi:hypothetical protein
MSPVPSEVEALLHEVQEVTQEIALLGGTSDALRAYRVELCRRARALGVTTKVLGDVSGVSGVAITQWLQQPVPAPAA